MERIGKLDRQALARRLAEHGVHPSESALAELHALLPAFAALAARVHRRFEFADEPAHVPGLDPAGVAADPAGPEDIK